MSMNEIDDMSVMRSILDEEKESKRLCAWFVVGRDAEGNNRIWDWHAYRSLQEIVEASVLMRNRNISGVVKYGAELRHMYCEEDGNYYAGEDGCIKFFEIQ